MDIATTIWVLAFIVCSIALVMGITFSVMYWRSRPSDWKKRLTLTLVLMLIMLAGIIRSAIAIAIAIFQD